MTSIRIDKAELVREVVLRHYDETGQFPSNDEIVESFAVAGIFISGSVLDRALERVRRAPPSEGADHHEHR